MSEIETWLRGRRDALNDRGYCLPVGCNYPGVYWHGYTTGKTELIEAKKNEEALRSK